MVFVSRHLTTHKRRSNAVDDLPMQLYLLYCHGLTWVFSPPMLLLVREACCVESVSSFPFPAQEKVASQSV